jgi:RNase adapter protein RapZ
MSDAPVQSVVVVTGLSGAGKSTALHALEDLGFFCIDNLPTVMAPEAVAVCARGGVARIALGMDVRVREFLGEMSRVLAQLAGAREDGASVDSPLRVLFLDASDEALLRRFNETRRPHPLARQGHHQEAVALLESVAAERERLSPLRARADDVIDTTSLSVHELRRTVIDRFGPSSGGAPPMSVRLVSFGFKYGAPVDADVVLDVRFLDNPHFVPALRALPGTDARVMTYVLENPETKGFLEHAHELLAFSLPKYEREGKSYLTIAIGCTGGRHRSVVIAHELGRLLQAAQRNVTVYDRDLSRAEGGTR